MLVILIFYHLKTKHCISLNSPMNQAWGHYIMQVIKYDCSCFEIRDHDFDFDYSIYLLKCNDYILCNADYVVLACNNWNNYLPVKPYIKGMRQ